MRVKKADRGIKLEEGQGEDRRRGHAVREQPEEELLVAEEPVARKGVGGGQGDGDWDHRVQRDIDDRVDITPVPGRIGEDDDVVVEGESLGEEAEPVLEGVGLPERAKLEGCEQISQQAEL